MFVVSSRWSRAGSGFCWRDGRENVTGFPGEEVEDPSWETFKLVPSSAADTATADRGRSTSLYSCCVLDDTSSWFILLGFRNSSFGLWPVFDVWTHPALEPLCRARSGSERRRTRGSFILFVRETNTKRENGKRKHT